MDESRVFVLRVKGRARKVLFEQVLAVGSHSHVAGEALIRRKRVDLCHRNERRQRFVNTLGSVVVCCCSRNSREVFSTLVVNDTFDIKSLSCPRAWGLVVCAHPIVACRLRGSYEDHVALSDLDVDNIRLVWSNLGGIHVDDLQCMPVDIEFVCGLNGAIDETQQVRLPRFELNRQLETLSVLITCTLNTPSVLAVDQAVVHSPGTAIDGVLCVVVHRVHCLVGPVLEEDKLTPGAIGR
jgi:hypothetical protein